ncbi:MAG: enoyl-CoA hydratase/isomerase family protein, partial [Planctomycetes bacterium]|nr:enoyl-CoA hydratase/isomerase family protein [Planctomycetota bacterium]
NVIDELYDAFNQIKKDTEIGAVVITGAEKAFVAGADIKELSQLNPQTGKEKMLRGQGLFTLIETCGKPVIAAINGFALGGGCEMALACTIRLASEKAKLGQPEVNLGVIPGYGGTQRLVRLLGKGRAMELVLTADIIDAAEADRIGLVNKVYPADQLLAEAEKLARKIMSKGPLAIKASLEAINRGSDLPLEQGLELEAQLFADLCGTADMKEGLQAFLEKRKPNFKGK